MAIDGNHGLWGDLHRADLNPAQSNFSIIGIPYDALQASAKAQRSRLNACVTGRAI